jgi:uncharacterized protein (DUF1778 family)
MPKTEPHRTHQIGVRVSEDERAQIDERAAEAKMTLTAYMIAAALGELKPASRLERIEKRLAKLERQAKEAREERAPDAAAMSAD